MTHKNLAPIYLDNELLRLNADQPTVSAILAARGRGATTQIRRLSSALDEAGTDLAHADIIDRTQTPETAIFLRSGKTNSASDRFVDSMDPRRTTATTAAEALGQASAGGRDAGDAPPSPSWGADDEERDHQKNKV